MTPNDRRKLEDTVTYKPGWQLIVHGHLAELYWAWSAPCCITGKMEAQHSRVWSIRGMNEEQAVKTAFLAAKTAEEHELLENFKYRGIAVFNPHTPIAALMRAQGAQ